MCLINTNKTTGGRYTFDVELAGIAECMRHKTPRNSLFPNINPWGVARFHHEAYFVCSDITNYQTNGANDEDTAENVQQQRTRLCV